MQKILLALFIFAAALPTRVVAWSQFGHVLVCEIAYRVISDDAREELNILIENQTFEDELHGGLKYPSFNHGCLREDQVRNRPKEHYINYPRDWARVEDGDCPGWNPCLLSAIRDDMEVLADEAAPVDARLAAVLALGHWVGDLHQPLHVSFSDDRGGNQVSKRGSCRASNLHSVWDRCLVERRVIYVEQPENPEDYAEFTPMYRAADRLLEDTSPSNIATWISSEPWEWAAESFDLVRSAEVQYCVMVGDRCQYTETNSHHDGEQANEKQVRVDKEYLDQFGPVAQLRLTQAGFRLAALIDEALAK